MKVRSAVVLASFLAGGSAFQVAPTRRALAKPAAGCIEGCFSVRTTTTTSLSAAATEGDCGCGSSGPEILSGDVPQMARSLNVRQALRTADVYRVSGEAIPMDELLNRGNNKLSVLVFLRSLG